MFTAGKEESLDPRLSWATLTQVERDAAYDNTAAVKNSLTLIAERNKLSATLIVLKLVEGAYDLGNPSPLDLATIVRRGE